MSITEDSAPVVDSQTLHKPRYRQAVPVPADLTEHIHILLDTDLYKDALILLTDLVVSGASNPQCASHPAFAPDPYHIELISALLIHPKYTNQITLDKEQDLGSRSITLLRNVLAILGPVNAGLGEAFSLVLGQDSHSRTSRRSRNAVDSDSGSSSPETDEFSKTVSGVIAHAGRIRKCARGDFWNMVGWAFNCSVNYPKRWKYWKVWLGYMLDVLDEDWLERERLDVEAESSDGSADSNDEHESKMLRQSLLVNYLSKAAKSSSVMERVVRSVFAAGDPDDEREFPEIFPNETKEVKHQNGQKRKREELMSRNFVDYDDEEAEVEFDSSEQTPEPNPGADETNSISGADYLGGMESIILRQRVITLLSRASAVLPDSFGYIKEVYDEFRLCTKQLPLPAFSLFMTPSIYTKLPEVVFVSLSQRLLCDMLVTSAPRPQTVTGRDDDELTGVVLERCFLPFPASTCSVSDNAKVSILVEGIFRLLSRVQACDFTPGLEAALEKGILARERKIKADRRKKETSARREQGDLIWLRASAQRMRSQLSWMKQLATKA
ncbi:hypothetical protein MBM_07362 [Drepanopeziza brunnea f. sp. 'multigermtubi' MB_m1]|uniref:Uncharacterized protein n=1 Tax=Marssonina brunnea f. sp. multigermtubi (strain MB_m1) TaxID=1072389 RepID=K1WP00_MARBU|nr:uncharacterized protein MBM_07362 [Drepanopeziza brunnea f. sp. 'multigermtubi' MB_m1]EKD14641.1 hypothetical protein MBM_07362 [Drepanopeziza brunnea f. sp. 'multigermtubi' MB_m1]